MQFGLGCVVVAFVLLVARRLFEISFVSLAPGFYALHTFIAVISALLSHLHGTS